MSIARRAARLKRLLPVLLADAAKPYIGGQAVIEGVMMRSPSSFVIAVRSKDDAIAVRAQPWDNLFTRFRLFRLPLLRGGVVLLESLWNGYVALEFAAQHAKLPEDATAEDAAAQAESKDEQPSKLQIGATLATSLLLGLVLFMGVPHLATWGLGKAFGSDLDTTSFAFHAIDGVIRLLVFLAYILLISRMKEIQRVFQYHGAEHQAIWAYEKGTSLSVDDAHAQSTLHPRCGTSFLLLVVGVSIVLFAAVLPLVPRVAESDLLNTLAMLGIKLPLAFPIAGLSYELQRLSARYPKNLVLRVLTAPGLWMQRITTQPPSRDQAEIAVVAMRRCIAYEEGRGGTNGVQLCKNFDEAIAGV